MNDTNLKYLLALLEVPGIGNGIAKKLYALYPEFSLLFGETAPVLRTLGLTEAMIANIKKPNWEYVEKVFLWRDKPNHQIIDFENHLYPQLLREITGFPLILYVDGNANILNTPQLAVVGSRNPTHQGSENAFNFSKALASFGLTITSGLALGIDGASHKGALAASGFTIGILGTGIEYVYPKRHVALAQEILANGGALISEFPIGTPVLAENFPKRNRIISGMSLGTFVVEANLQSGSLITAKFAIEQNREVFAIPGSIHNPLARGTNHLIQEGAKLVETVEDVVAELNFIVKKINCTIIRKENSIKDNKVEHLDQSYKKLLNCIEYEPTSFDVLAARSHLSAKEIASMLVILELDGYIKPMNGGYIKT